MLGGLISLLMLSLLGVTMLGWGFITIFVWIFLFERLRRIFPEFIAMLGTTIIESVAVCWSIIGLINLTRGNAALENFSLLAAFATIAAVGVWSIRSGAWNRP